MPPRTDISNADENGPLPRHFSAGVPAAEGLELWQMSLPPLWCLGRAADIELGLLRRSLDLMEMHGGRGIPHALLPKFHYSVICISHNVTWKCCFSTGFRPFLIRSEFSAPHNSFRRPQSALLSKALGIPSKQPESYLLDVAVTVYSTLQKSKVPVPTV